MKISAAGIATGSHSRTQGASFRPIGPYGYDTHPQSDNVYGIHDRDKSSYQVRVIFSQGREACVCASSR